MRERLTMGSLFDGIGGFPLAAVRRGFPPVWALGNSVAIPCVEFVMEQIAFVLFHDLP